jgi:hypothetical protein
MGSDSVSTWLIALVGTIAGLVGAIAAVLQVLQSRQSSARQTSNSAGSAVPSPRSIPARRRASLPGMSPDNESRLAQDPTFVVFMGSLWVAFILLIFWLAIAILDIHSSTIPAYIIMAEPALAAFILEFFALIFSAASIAELAMPDFLWNASAFVIVIMVVVTAIKVMT